MENVKCLDGLALVHETFYCDLDAIPQTPCVNLKDLDLAFDVKLLVLCPAVNVPNPSDLAGNADTLAKAGTHSPFREPGQCIAGFPALLADQVAAHYRPASAFPSLAVYYDCPSRLRLRAFQPITHASHDVGYQCERRWVMVRPGVMPYPPVDLRVRITGAFGAKLPYRPFFAMFVV